MRSPGSWYFRSVDAFAQAAPPGDQSGSTLPADKLKRMMGILNYQSDRGKTVERQEASKEALVVYHSLSDRDNRKAFLDAFDESGKGKDLKFAKTFEQSLANARKTEVATNENFWIRTCIGKPNTYEFISCIGDAGGNLYVISTPSQE